MMDKLALRFKENTHRHPTIPFEKLRDYLDANPAIVSVLEKMEETGGEPDLFEMSGGYYLVDASRESPDRRKLCYDREASLKRKTSAPESSVQEEVERIRSTLLDETLYRRLQEIEAFDIKTSSWLKTPDAVRALGGALFGDRRYDRVFIYHNGAESYYSSRGIRTYIQLTNFPD